MAMASLESGVARLGWRATAAKIGIFLTIAVAVVQFMIGGFDMVTGAVLSPASPLILVYLLRTLLFLGSAVFIGMWIHRAHANLYAAEIDGLGYTPGWSVGWFFVPFANLVQPFSAMKELWDNSIPDHNTAFGNADGRLKLWWGGFLGANILDNIASRVTVTEPIYVVLDIAGAAAMITSAWCLWQIIHRVTQAQQAGLGIGHVFA